MVIGTTAPRVTIVLPTHNRADVIGFAIQSALAQTMTDFELLVVGDGCTDNTADVVHGFADKRVRWSEYPKAFGFGHANRNKALAQARGDVIAYLEHDDLWFPDHLDLLLRCLDGSGAELAYGRTIHVTVRGHYIVRPFNLEDPRTMHAWLTRDLGYLTQTSVVHKTSCLTKYGFWREDIAWASDWELWRRIARGGSGRNFAHEPTPTCLHFTASWKTELALVGSWLALQHRAHGLPHSSIETPRNMTQQEAVWRSLTAQPPTSFRRVRGAAQIAMDRGANVDLPLMTLATWANRVRRHLMAPPATS